VNRLLLADDVHAFLLESPGVIILALFVMAKRQFIDEVSQIMIRLALEAFSIAVNSPLEVSNGLLCLSLLEALIADLEVGAAGFVVVFLHHYIASLLL
jgi:hypothetical protein